MDILMGKVRAGRGGTPSQCYFDPVYLREMSLSRYTLGSYILRAICEDAAHGSRVRVRALVAYPVSPDGTRATLPWAPYALRYTAGHSVDVQPFLRPDRLGIAMNETLARMNPGAFHVTTLENALSMLATGIHPGADMDAAR